MKSHRFRELGNALLAEPALAPGRLHPRVVSDAKWALTVLMKCSVWHVPARKPQLIKVGMEWAEPREVDQWWIRDAWTNIQIVSICCLDVKTFKWWEQLKCDQNWANDWTTDKHCWDPLPYHAIPLILFWSFCLVCISQVLPLWMNVFVLRRPTCQMACGMNRIITFHQVLAWIVGRVWYASWAVTCETSKTSCRKFRLRTLRMRIRSIRWSRLAILQGLVSWQRSSSVEIQEIVQVVYLEAARVDELEPFVVTARLAQRPRLMAVWLGCVETWPAGSLCERRPRILAG